MVLALLSLLLQVVGLVLGYVKMEGRLKAIFLSLFETLSFVLGVWIMGWTGVWIMISSVVISLFVFGAYLAIKQDDSFTKVSVHTGEHKKRVGEMHYRLRKMSKSYRTIMADKQQRLLELLSQRHRTLTEMELMVPHIANLYVVHRPEVELEELVPKFDRLMRHGRYQAKDAERLANLLADEKRRSPGDLGDVMDELLGDAS